MYKRHVAALIPSLLIAACATAGTPVMAPKPSSPTLAPCEAKHCVSSAEPGTDYFIAPLHYTGSRAAARDRLLQIIRQMPRATVESTDESAIHATFRSAIFGFVDDLDLRLPADEPQVDVRSSSRVGYYDFGVNRKRVEQLRQALAGQSE